MEFTFETEYNLKALSIMAKALRKTIRKSHSLRSHIFGWIITILAIFLLLSKPFVFSFKSVVTLLAVIAIISALLFEDKMNGYFAKKRLLSGTEKAISTFSEASFSSTTELGKTEWNYDKIKLIAESCDFFIFIFSANHAQLYDKNSLKGGTVEDFRSFITTATRKPSQVI